MLWKESALAIVANEYFNGGKADFTGGMIKITVRASVVPGCCHLLQRRTLLVVKIMMPY